MNLGMEWMSIVALLLATSLAWRLRRQSQMHLAERWREQRIREELEAYARLDPSVAPSLNGGIDSLEATKELARRVCRVVADKSAFTRVTLMLRDAEGKYACVGSVGCDDLTVAALHEWGEKMVAEERAGRTLATLGTKTGEKSFSIALGEWKAFDAEVGTWARSGKRERRKWRRAILAPIRIGGGRMVGAIAICADGQRMHGTAREEAWTGPGLSGGLARAMGPIETLAARLSTAMENEALTARLLRTEKLAGLGQLAGGVAHALNNPLTAVLGFAELIAETTGEPRVKKDAETILGEAKKMKETVQRLVDFWRPSVLADEAVDVALLLRELASVCEEKLKERGVTLEVAAESAPLVRGGRDRLRQVFEHLLNNAAQAIANARPREEDEEHAIRITVSHDETALHVIVSDTGPGFEEPGKVFDPFYTTKGPEQGAGLGLSICYGIVREHGGEISAFNLHPHGAAVIVELPVKKTVEGEGVERLLIRDGEQSRV